MSSIKTTQIDGDVSVGRNVSLGGKAEIAGSAHIGHNLKVDGWLEAPNIKGANKGIFLTVQELRKAYPVPHDGWMAGVGASTPFTAYVGKGDDWVTTGGTIEVTVDMNQYTEGVAHLQEDIDEVAARVRTAETNKADKNSVYTKTETDTKFSQLEQEQIQGGIYDVSAHNNSAVFESLQALLNSPNLSTLIPISVRHGGMSIRFINSDNKYVQYRLMANAWSTIVTNWQGIDSEPTAGSDNLVKSGGVLKKIQYIDIDIQSNEKSINDAILLLKFKCSYKDITLQRFNNSDRCTFFLWNGEQSTKLELPVSAATISGSVYMWDTQDVIFIVDFSKTQKTIATTSKLYSLTVNAFTYSDVKSVLKKIRYLDIQDGKESINDAILLLKFKCSYKDITLQRFNNSDRCTFYLWDGEQYTSLALPVSAATISGSVYMWDTQDVTFIVDFSKTQETASATSKLYSLTVNAFTYSDVEQEVNDSKNAVSSIAVKDAIYKLENANPYIYYESEYLSLANAILELAFYRDFDDISLQRFDYDKEPKVIRFFKWADDSYTIINFKPSDAIIVGNVYTWDNEYARLVVDFSKTNVQFGTTTKINRLKIGAFVGKGSGNSAISPTFVLPKYIDCPIGMENNIFLDSVHSEPDWNTDKVNVLADNTVLTSKRFIRKEFSSSEENELVANFHRVDDNLVDVYAAQTVFRPVVRGGQNKTVNICVSGSSNIDGTEQAPELFRLLAADGDVTVNQIGTRHANSGGVTYNHEGRGGWSWKVYTDPIYENTPYSGKLNAFMYNGKLDFKHYMNTNFPDLSGIDIFVMNLGSNDVGQGVNLATNESVTNIINYAKTFIDALHNDYPNCKFIVGMPSIGAPCQYKGDRRSIIYKKSIQMLNKAYIDNFDDGNYNVNTLVCPFTIFMNRDALFKHTDIVIDSTYSPLSQNDNQFDIAAKEERIYTDIIHCTSDGYKSWGSGLYRTVRAVIDGLYD